MASGSGDKTIKLWNFETRTEIITLQAHSEAVVSLVFSPDSKYLVSGTFQEMKVWSVQSQKEINKLFGKNNSIAFSPDGRYLASGSDNKTVHLWSFD